MGNGSPQNTTGTASPQGTTTTATTSGDTTISGNGGSLSVGDDGSVVATWPEPAEAGQQKPGPDGENPDEAQKPPVMLKPGNVTKDKDGKGGTRTSPNGLKIRWRMEKCWIQYSIWTPGNASAAGGPSGGEWGPWHIIRKAGTGPNDDCSGDQGWQAEKSAINKALMQPKPQGLKSEFKVGFQFHLPAAGNVSVNVQFTPDAAEVDSPAAPTPVRATGSEIYRNGQRKNSTNGHHRPRGR